MLCLIELGRSRVISVTREIYDVLISPHKNYYMQDERYGWEDRMGKCVAPSVSIKDRSVVGCADRGLNCTNRIPGVGGSRNR